MRQVLSRAALRVLYEAFEALQSGQPADLAAVAAHDPALRDALGLAPRLPADIHQEVRSYLDHDATDGGRARGAIYD